MDDLNKISAWSAIWEMSFNIKKCHILQVGTRNLNNYYEMSGKKLESVYCVKDLSVTITSNLKFSQQCKDAAGKANKMLGFIKKKFSFKNKDVLLPLYKSLVRPHLERLCGSILVTSSSKRHSKIRSCPAQGYEDDPFLA